MNAARIPVDPDLLAAFLCLPPSTRITGVVWDPMNHLVLVRADGPEMPHYEAGKPIPTLQPTYRRIDHQLESPGTGAQS